MFRRRCEGWATKAPDGGRDGPTGAGPPLPVAQRPAPRKGEAGAARDRVAARPVRASPGSASHRRSGRPPFAHSRYRSGGDRRPGVAGARAGCPAGCTGRRSGPAEGARSRPPGRRPHQGRSHPGSHPPSRPAASLTTAGCVARFTAGGRKPPMIVRARASTSSQAASASELMGTPSRYPCTMSHPMAANREHCSTDSTPSTATVTPLSCAMATSDASRRTDGSAISTVSASWRSILTLSTGARVSSAGPAEPDPKPPSASPTPTSLSRNSAARSPATAWPGGR